MSWRIVFVATLLLGACDHAPSAADDTAAELRALRVFLQQQQQQQPSARGHAADVADARSAIADALAPMREIVTTLSKAQDEQAARQLALTQEMQRWSQLLVENVAAAHAGDAKAMSARLQQLEQAMREQDARHREVEGLLQGALERTADRLQEFLRRLEPAPANAPSSAPAPGAAKPNVDKPSADKPSADKPSADKPSADKPSADKPSADKPSADKPSADKPSADKPGADKAGGDKTTGATAPAVAPVRDDHPPSSGRGSLGALHVEQWGWLALAALGIALGAFFVKRSRQQAPALAGNALAAGVDPVQPGHQHDPGVDQIWAAAALLGETVSRLRQTATAGATASAPAPVPASETADRFPGELAVRDELAIDEVFVFDAFEEESPVEAAAEKSAADRIAADRIAAERTHAAKRPANGRAGAGAPGPDLVVCRLATADLDRARTTAANVLAGDPRVLRRPAPSVVAKGNRVEVTFATLPGLAAGERSLLEQRLRDAVI